MGLGLALLTATSASAQRSTVRFEAHPTECWSSSEAPCESVHRAEIEYRARTRATLRVVAVEVAVDPAGPWQAAEDVQVMRRSEMARTEPVHRTAPTVRVARGEHDVLLVTFRPIRLAEATVRVTLDVDGRRSVVLAPHTLVSISE